MNYEILIKYRTGDSFTSEDREEVLEISFENLEVAKENLQIIKKHYQEIYLKLDRGFLKFEDKQKLCEKYSNEPWFFVKKYFADENNNAYEPPKGIKQVFDADSSQYNLNLKNDNGTYFRLHCFWCGYFESLYGAEIVMPKDESLSFNLRGY